MKKNERLQALRVLVKLTGDKVSLSHSFSATKDISPLVREICFGVCRHYFRLQWVADKLMTKRPKSEDVWIVILMGLYQLLYLKKPDYATVQETVALLDAIKKSWAKGLVNAVLRTCCREKNALLNNLQEQDGKMSHPQWFVSRLQKDWPDFLDDILAANDKHPPMNLRVNSLHLSRDDYLARLRHLGIAATANRYSPDGVKLAVACDVMELSGFQQGDVSVQDEAAQLAVSLLALRPGLRVLDACCAPGGKTGHILESETQLQECVALDIDESRLLRVRDNLTRLGLQATLKQGDALNPALWWDGQLFDRILLDAPCSATGVIRRHPDIKLLRTNDDISRVCALQKNLLTQLWPLLKAGGRLVYATCSVIREENESQIAGFVADQADCKPVSEEKPWGQYTGHGWQILPGEEDCDGFFYSVLDKME
ncbi:16S rRNA (cytosine(967)-C(5))-methyltransferase RsmB [Legionella spiritensis]|uniref:16S rRNA (cytosine(967)-C(5))-methyltransferase RsmB n=1 Tax=Legionella spiritensis TaxID=452 RepID=UPI000F6E30B5|nr:16S rRNA (cytosine(967)-C(5))-methyltransferase RsmB [Legionella spiritensis]VEG91301.1 Sun protein [Legionella spiritensis]